MTAPFVGPPAPPLVTTARQASVQRRLRQIVLASLIVSGVLSFGYAGLSLYVATRLIYVPPTLPVGNPGQLGLAYQDVTFASREDGLRLRGWFIPGVQPDGQLSARQVIIMVHGTRANRTDPGAGMLQLEGALAKQGLAVLAFDMRGAGESAQAPLSLGFYEQRDVLGAVDFLRSGPMPYPALGRPQAIGGWGVSMGAATLLLAAAREPAIRAIVSDSAYADIIPILNQQIPKNSGLPPAFTPGALAAVRIIYGFDFAAVRPVDVVAQIAPRPILFIHGTADDYVPTGNLPVLAAAARKGAHAQVQTWLVAGARHAQSFKVAGDVYVQRVVQFYAAALGAPYP